MGNRVEHDMAFIRQKGCIVSRWTCATVPHPFQNDSVSCGVFVCKYAECILLDKPTEFPAHNDAVKNIRRHIALTLLKESDDLQHVCHACGETEVDNTDTFPFTDLSFILVIILIELGQ
ncbi:hypothetical protein SKAU_G00415290 [Synaphobranchus kaupii]|uniref:Ubiquitin-like protease family profile domain-containing protein n=1 Tax=Synaphobranchus kaupii TaxID=118154 RepID=A0A9Q1E795_SYNKA|nr:hypothetical protein SKAU_G00415290 [Synaphobranchus kaupii]